MAKAMGAANPYSAVSAAPTFRDAIEDDGLGVGDNNGEYGGGDVDVDVDDDDQHGIIAAQSLDLELEQDHHEMRSRERSIRSKLLASACLLMAMVFGGREYYVRNYNGQGGSGLEDGPDGGDGYSLLSGSGMRGRSSSSNSNDLLLAGVGSISSSNDLEVAEELFEGANNDDEADGMVLDLVEGGGDEDANGGVVEYEGDLDDEIAEGEVDGSDFDSEEELYPEETESVEGELEGEAGEDDAAGKGDEGFEESSPEDKDEAGEEVWKEEAEEEEEEELPDYFVPLAPDEREQFKERLRSTLRETKAALLASGGGGGSEGAGGTIAKPQRTLVLDSDSPKQFMHMHHMKTGGTSLDGLISCSLRRQSQLNNNTRIPYSRLSECGSTVKRCMDTLATELDATVVENVFYRNDANGTAQVDDRYSFDPADEADDNTELNVCKTSDSNVMSYCASLHAVQTFGWREVDKVTVIRDPVDRAWSMYKFSLNGCYHCMEMKDVLRSVLNGTFVGRRRGPPGKNKAEGEGDDEGGGPNFKYSPNDSCAVQMIGHQATNLLSSLDLYNIANDVSFLREREIAEEAVRNLREEFTWIGITDRIAESIDGFRSVFPFLSENLNDAASEIGDVLEKSGGRVGDGGFSLVPEGYNDEKGCPFEHRNAGRAPSCGTKEMDEETISLIRRLSNRDVAVYKAAVERFELQNEVLAEYRAGDL